MGESFGVGIVGCGYVGPVTAACLAHLGHRVVCVDKAEGKLAGLRAGRLPIYEPGVQEWFLDGGASPATAALLKRSFGGLERSGGALHIRRKRSRRRMGRALDALTAKDARGFLSHCGYCSKDQLP
jgi:glycine/D-amino acid oxidase-like deaminating enzyme